MKLSRFEKRFMALTLALAMVLCLIPATKKADAAVGTDTAGILKEINYNAYHNTSKDYKYGDFTYFDDENGNVVITGYKGSDKKVTIPDKIGDKTVIGIKGTFKNNTTVTDVVLPSSVVRIEYEAFYGATNLVNVNLDNTERIGRLCFYGCENLGDIVLPECLVDIDSYGIFNGAHIKSLTVSNYLAGLPKSLGYVTVDDIGFKDGIKKIWMNFKSISTPVIRIPDSVVDMKYAEFSDKNKKVIIGKGVTEIYRGQFSGYYCCPQVVLGENIKTIGQSAFSHSQITQLVIPDSVTELQYRAFYDTSKLKNITFSKNLVKVVGGYCGCMEGSLWYDDQKDGVVYTGSVLYAYKGYVPENTTINVKSGTKGIAYMALQTKDGSGGNITKVTLPDGLQYIGGVSFFNTGIKDINIPETVTEIGPGAFGNTNLKTVYIPKSVTKIGAYSLGYNCKDAKDDGAVWINEECFIDSFYTATYTTDDGYTKKCSMVYDDLKMNDKNKIVSDKAVYCDVAITSNIALLEAYDSDTFYSMNLDNTKSVYNTTKVSDFTIKGYKGTAAESYAKANGFKFVELKDGIYEEKGVKYYYKNNVKATNVTDVVKDPRSSKWYNVVKGKVVVGPTLAKNSSGWWYIGKNGTVDFSYTGLYKYNGSWWYIKNGKLDFGYTGLAKYNGSWWYVKAGKVDFGYTGLCKYNGSWWYVKAGKVDFGYTGLCKYNGSWWYVKAGKVDFGYTGLAKYNGSWWYVKTGKVDFGFTGLCKYNGSWWYVKTGKVDFGYNSLCKYNGSWWYIKGGKVNFGYTGTAKYNGKTFNVKNGKVVF